MTAPLIALALALAADAPTLPTREEASRAPACPPGTERVGAAPPEGFEVWCERPDRPPATRREGPFRAWYDDGGLFKAGGWADGLPEGAYQEWHRNGRPARAGSWRAGLREGTWTTWLESGQREEECGYERGERHGRFATWWPNGRRRVEGRYCRGLQCGTWVTWDEQGRELGKITYEEIRGTP